MTSLRAMEVAVEIVDELLKNFNDRSGFSTDSLPEDIQDEWRKSWNTIVLGFLYKETLKP